MPAREEAFDVIVAYFDSHGLASARHGAGNILARLEEAGLVVSSATSKKIDGYDVPAAAIEAARASIGGLVPSSVDSPELTEIVVAVLESALPFFVPKERHVHYHVPPDSVLHAAGDVVRIEPAPLLRMRVGLS